MVEERRVFLCHATEDKEIASHMCDVLEANNLSCWIAPRDIEPGHDYGEEIVKAIEKAAALVLILSTHSNESEHVKREVERAVNKSIEIIPFRIEEILPSKSLEYFISTTQWVDAFTPPLEDHILLLVESLKASQSQAVGERPGSTSEVAPPYREGRARRSWWLRWPGLVTLISAVLVLMGVTWGVFHWRGGGPILSDHLPGTEEQPRWPWTSERLVTDSDLAPYSNYALSLMRNEIYARKGWIFTHDELRNYFGKQKWYKPAGDPADQDKINNMIKSQLNYYERENGRRIRDFEIRRR